MLGGAGRPAPACLCKLPAFAAAACCAGEQAVKAPVLNTFIQLWAMGDLPTAQLVQGTSLQADVFSLLADCTIALKQRLEAARPEPISHEDLKKLMVLVAGMNHSGLLSARKQVGGPRCMRLAC